MGVLNISTKFILEQRQIRHNTQIKTHTHTHNEFVESSEKELKKKLAKECLKKYLVKQCLAEFSFHIF